MDRFIVKIDEDKALDLLNLKSNMDRFIGLGLYLHFNSDDNLKSNMDRFIGNTILL